VEEKEVDLRDYLRMLRKRWKIILIVFLISTATAAIVSLLLPKTYESIGMVRIGRMRDKLLEEPSTIIEIIKTRPLLRKVAEKLNIAATQERLRELASKIKLREKSGLLEIKGRGENPEEALRLAEAVSAVLLERHELILEQAKLSLEEYLVSGKKRLAEMERDIEMLQKKIDELKTTDSEAKATVARGYMESLERSRDRYEQLQLELRTKKMEESYGTVSSELVVPPAIPEKPVAPKKKQNVMIAGFLGLFVGFMLAASVEYFEKPTRIS